MNNTEYDDEPHQVFDNEYLEDIIDTKTWKFKKCKQKLNLLNFFKIRTGQFRTNPEHIENHKVIDTVKQIKRIFGARDRPIHPSDQLDFLRDKHNYEQMYRQSLNGKGENLDTQISQIQEDESFDETFYALQDLPKHSKHASLSSSPLKQSRNQFLLKKSITGFQNSNNNNFSNANSKQQTHIKNGQKVPLLQSVNKSQIHKLRFGTNTNSNNNIVNTDNANQSQYSQQEEMMSTNRSKNIRIGSPTKKFNSLYHNVSQSDSPKKMQKPLTRMNSNNQIDLMQRSNPKKQQQQQQNNMSTNTSSVYINLQPTNSFNRTNREGKFDLSSPLKRHNKQTNNNNNLSSRKRNDSMQQQQIQQQQLQQNGSNTNIMKTTAKKNFFKSKYWSSNDLSNSPSNSRIYGANTTSNQNNNQQLPSLNKKPSISKFQTFRTKKYTNSISNNQSQQEQIYAN